MAKGKAKKRMANTKAEKQVFSSNWEDLHDDLLDLILEKLVSLSDIIKFCYKVTKSLFFHTESYKVSTMANCKAKAEKQEFSSNWADLHDDLLDLILEKLVSLSDIVRFSLVCKPWSSKALIHKQKLMPLVNHQPPCLLINTYTKNRNKRNRSLHNIIDGSEILKNKFKLCIPYEYEGKYCYGSSYGWLLYQVRKGVIILFDPLSGAVIHLPPILIPDTFETNWVTIPCVKFLVLSNDPYLGSFEVLASYSVSQNYEIVAHLRFGKESWTYSERISIVFCSFAFYKSCILGVSESGGIWSLDIIHSSNGSSSTIEFKEIAAGLNKNIYSLPLVSTFVETTNGDLLMLQKYWHRYPELVYKIFKIISSNVGQFDIIPIEKLDGHSLFLDRNSLYFYQCISVLASNFAGCRENSIYYSNREFKVEGQRLIFKCITEEFNLEDQSHQTNEQSFPVSNIEPTIQSVFWLVPSIKLTCKTN